jgi:AcrR family transcriptional regulator
MFTASTSSKAQQSAETREAILVSCLGLFAKHGFSSTSVDEIARAAGITKGAVYWHFKNKEELFQAILERIRERWRQEVMKPLSSKATSILRLEALLDGYAELFGDAPEFCLFMQRVLLENDKEFSPQIAKLFTQTARFIARIVADGKASGEFRADVDATLTAHMNLGMIAGASQQCLANRSLSLGRLLSEVKATVIARVRR